MAQGSAVAGGPIGRRLRRVEDMRLLTGNGRYVADLPTRLPPLHLAVLRSPHAHARLAGIDAGRAVIMPGVAAVLTAHDLAGVGDLPCDWVVPGMAAVPRHPVLARDRVRYVGQPVAAVAAGNPALALDALEAIRVTYDPLPAVTDAEAALAAGAPTLHETVAGNRAFTFARSGGEPFDRVAARADVVVLRRRIVNNRVAPVPLEGRAVLSDHDPATGQLVHRTSTQLPHVHQRALAEALGFPMHRLQLVSPDVGGGFGAKLSFYAEDVLAALLAVRLGRPVRWVEGRGEGFLATTHGRDQVQDVELAADADGRVLALRVRATANLGAHALGMGPGVPAVNTGLSVTGAYRIPSVEVTVSGAYTNTAPVGPYRGAGHPEATFLIERMMDALAREVGLDPAEARRRNLIPADAFPYRLPTGLAYDSGDSHANLDAALNLAGYAERRAEQAAARKEGRLFGVGLATYVELSGAAPSIGMGALGFRRGGHESARVVLRPDGTATVFSGAHGQGHATCLAQIAAEALGVPVERIEVVQGDTAAIPFGTGTFNSRTMAVGGTAVHLACTRLIEKATVIAANLLQQRSADLAYADDRFRVRDEGLALARRLAHAANRAGAGVKGAVFRYLTGLGGLPPRIAAQPGGTISLAEVTAAAYLGHDLPLGMAPGLDETVFFDLNAMTASAGTHVAVAEVDAETGWVTLLRHVAVEDCGRVVNPLLAEGQVHGGAAQGIGQALLERVVYDGASGQLLTGSFADYAVPRAKDLPSFVTAHTVSLSPLNPLGVKGIGEGAAIGAPPAVVAAVLDALHPLGVTALDMPLTPQTVWRAIRYARS